MWRAMSGLVVGLLTLVATSCQRSTAPVEVTDTFDPAAPGFIVRYHSGVDPVAMSSRS